MNWIKSRALAIFIVFLLVNISGLAKSNQIIINATPGETYTLPNEILNTKIIINGMGSKKKPFIITGSKYQTKLTGNSFIHCQGSHIVIKNINFVNNHIFYKESDALVKIGNSKDRLSNITLKDCNFIYLSKFNDQDVETQFFWVRVTAENTKIERCTFEGKQNRLPIIHIDSKNKGNIITKCIFRNVKSRKGEALEAIRVGLTNGASDCKIIDNIFQNYFGDSETISCKADGVVIFNNKFVDSRSGVSIRAGDNCIVKNNSFINVVTPIRLCGSGNVIDGNVFKSRQKSITIMKGGGSYKPVKNLTLKNNNFQDVFILKILETKDHSELPDKIELSGNIIDKIDRKVKIKNRIILKEFFMPKNDDENKSKNNNSKIFEYLID